MELQVALQEWHRRIPEYELAHQAQLKVTWPAEIIGVDYLPIVFPRGSVAK